MRETVTAFLLLVTATFAIQRIFLRGRWNITVSFVNKETSKEFARMRAFKNVSAMCLRIHFDMKLGTEDLEKFLNFRLDRAFFVVHIFYPGRCIISSTHAYLYMLKCNLFLLPAHDDFLCDNKYQT